MWKLQKDSSEVAKSDDSMRLMRPVVPLRVCGHKCWRSSQDRLCMPWIMHMKDLICYCTCIVSRSMQSSSYLLSSYLGLVSYLSPLLLSVCSVSFMNHALNEEKSLVKSIIISCQKIFCVLIGCLTNVMSKKCLPLPSQYYLKHTLPATSVEFQW